MRAYHEEYRYRVVEVLHVSSGGVEAWNIYEYKSLGAAKLRETELLVEGKSVLFQTAKIIWMTPNELKAELSTLPKAAE